jgi:hypothetical protein
MAISGNFFKSSKSGDSGTFFFTKILCTNLTALSFGHQVAKFNKIECLSKFFPIGKDHFYLFIYL